MKKIVKKSLRDVDKQLADVGSTIVAKRLDSSATTRPADMRQKFLIDCTYIYSTNVNSGIQRVIRNIVHHISKYVELYNMELIAVALVNGAFVKIDIKKIARYHALSRSSSIIQRIDRKIALYFASFNQVEILYKDDILLMLDSSWYLNVWKSVAYAKDRGASVIGVTYDLIPISHPQFCDDTLGKVFDQWYKLSMHYFDGYLSISKSVMNTLQNYLVEQEADISRYSFDHFTLGSDFDTVAPSRFRRIGDIRDIFKNNSSVYLTVSTIEPRKNHKYVFEVFKKLWSRGIDIAWVIVGKEGWKVEQLLTHIKHHKEFGKRIFIINNLDDEGLRYCYRHAKALIFPSIIEGYGLPIAESLHHRLPVLASDTEIHREVGGDSIDYFDLKQSTMLEEMLIDIERGNKNLKKVDGSNITIPTWDDSARELFEKTLLIAQKRNNIQRG